MGKIKKKIYTTKTKKQSEDFSGMINFISNKFDETNNRFSDLEKMFRDLQGAVDSYAKRADTYFQEMVMLSHQINRHERWIRKIAEKMDLKLES